MKKIFIIMSCVILLSGICFAKEEIVMPKNVKIIKQSSVTVHQNWIATYLTVIDLANNEVVVLLFQNEQISQINRTGMFSNPADYK
jgi:hypothetical protein